MKSDRRFYQGRALERELRTLYEERGKLPDLSHLEKRRQRRATKTLVFLVLFFAVLTFASWAGFFLFGPQGSGGDATVKFEGPEIVVSGVPIDLKIIYKNLDRDPLALAALSLRFPEEIFVQSVNPPGSEGRPRWQFGTLPARASGEISIRVIPYGVPEDTLELAAIFSYKPANFNAEFQTSAAHKLVIRASALTAEISGPASATAGQPAAFTVKIQNHADETFENLQAAVEAPAVFVWKSQKTSGAEIFPLQTLAPGQAQEFTFDGHFASEAEGTQEFKVRLEIQRAETRFPLGEQIYQLELTPSALGLDLILNETPDLSWVRLNQTVAVRLTLQNRGQPPITAKQVRLLVSGDLIDWNSAGAEEGQVQLEARAISFPKSGALQLNLGETREFNARLPLSRNPPSAVAPLLEFSAELNLDDKIIRTAVKKLTVVSDLAISAEARYFGPDGKPVGTGPLPPKVGEETRYEMKLRLKNSFHDLDQLVVSAPLPPLTRFGGPRQVGFGRLTFDETAREVRWEIPRLPVTTTEQVASFVVATTPQPDDRNKLLPLLGVVRAETLDAISQVRFSADAPPTSSNLDADPFGRGKGVVQ